MSAKIASLQPLTARGMQRSLILQVIRQKKPAEPDFFVMRLPGV